MENKIRSFTDLTAWKRGHELVLMVYRNTDSFPQKERFSLTDQMRRAAVSITSNIAEGFSRQSQKEKVRFYSMAKASLTELQNQLLIARDIGYLAKEDFTSLANQSVQISKLLSGLIRAIRSRP
ncbi:MAG: hypothetical protein A3D64_02105 [Candidatus Wildermuthbacteria bacterium RIFCSPHIGHO2_02_FULL_49_9]|uniref:Four helix bundle protein n=1 Tax=Candidatus Wildermuthbacteria bacterium RIFCSPHIGHO2_02_FULL_49_9 TaxID=1802456 RepID=A0A1G2RD89_9BACT|nr:MAG: hypothetical protein A3D64_02105 [Candidatus Wildermuthbacteria bacterium RIFCSPHIGHO2_02_FULL_49_9]